MTYGVGLAWDLLAKDQASPAFLKVAGAADKAAASTARATSGVAASVAKMGRAGAELTKKVTVPLAGLAAVSVDQAAKYQKSLRTIQVVTGQTDQAMQRSGKGLLKIATATGTSLDQLTTGLYTVEKGGYRGAKALGILRAAAQGAKAENVDLGTATDALTSIMASYGKALGNPIAAENMIIKGSGLAKTTMTDFADSLSNVVPVASSLHIAFSDVAAAIATMTQHGETAQHATENLRNLITNLAGQNNVASQAMQQLGINTLDLQKNLGSRGLVGSLDVVLGRIGKLGKSGLIVTDTFKKSALATGSLHTMLKTFNGDLKTQSEGLLSGATNIKDYSKFAKDLGGQAGASALQFLSLYKSTFGFSNLLKSGKGDVQTYAATLQKALGGVTGMNVALQLSGESAKRFHDDAQQVADAAKGAGTDVLGWAKTQDTLSVRMDKAKEALQVLAVEIGTALIPVVSKIVDGISAAVHWFDSLSSTDKQIIGWSAVVLASLGPVLSIGSRLALVARGVVNFSGSVASALARLALASETRAAGIASAMRTITGSLLAAGAGFGVGSIVSGAVAGSSGYRGHTGKALIGLLGSAGGGAAAGAAVGSVVPGIGTGVGALVGGVAGAVSGVIGIFHHMDSAVQQNSTVIAAAMQANINWTNQFQASTEALLGTLKAVNGSMGSQYRQQIISQLGQNGVLSAAAQIGFSGKRVVSAALGNSKDQAAFLNQLGRAGLRGAARDFLDVAHAAGAAETRYEQETAAAGKNVVANGQLGTSLQKLRSALNTANTSLTDNSAIAQRNRLVLQANVGKINDAASAELKHGASVDAVARKYVQQISALDTNAQKLGFNRDEVQKLVAKYGQIPTRIRTYLEKQGVRPADIDAILAKYKLIPNTVSTLVTVDASQAYATLYNLQSQYAALGSAAGASSVGSISFLPKHHAAGGSVRDGWFTVGERGWELGYKSGPRVELLSNAQSKAATGWSKVPGYASGTGGTGLTSSAYGRAIGDITAALSRFAKVINQTGTDVRNSFATALDAFRLLGASRESLHRLAKLDNALAAKVNDRNNDMTRLQGLLQARAQEIGSIHGATMGSFDISTAGGGPSGSGRPSFGTIYAQALQDRNIVRKWAVGLRKLSSVFGRSQVGKQMLRRLAEAGPASWPQVEALQAANPKQLANLVATEAQISGTGFAVGSLVGGDLFNGQINSTRADLRGDRREITHELKMLRHDVQALADALHITLKVDGKVLATASASGANRNGRRS